MNAVQAVHKLYWYYVIGTSPRSARSKLRFLSFCDQNPWKDVKSSIVFLKFVSMDDLTFRQKQKKIRVTGTLSIWEFCQTRLLGNNKIK